jgi:hypothetical protein
MRVCAVVGWVVGGVREQRVDTICANGGCVRRCVLCVQKRCSLGRVVTLRAVARAPQSQTSSQNNGFQRKSDNTTTYTPAEDSTWLQLRSILLLPKAGASTAVSTLAFMAQLRLLLHGSRQHSLQLKCTFTPHLARPVGKVAACTVGPAARVGLGCFC